MADGSITFAVDLDQKKLEKKLSSIGGKLKKLEAELSKKKETQSGLGKELDDAKKSALETETAIQRLRTEMSALKAATSVEGSLGPEKYAAALERQKSITAELKEQTAALAQQDKETERIANQYTRCTDQVSALTEKINAQAEEYSAVATQIEGMNSKTSKMGEAVDVAARHMDKFVDRVKGLARRVLIFSVITAALRQLRTWTSRVVKTNDEAITAMARLKGALITLAQPLVSVVIPAFVTLVNVLTRIVSAIAWAMAAMFGQTIDQSQAAAQALDQETSALEGMGTAAKKAGNQLASFDEINKLADNTADGGGATTPAPDFDFNTTGLEADFDKILNVVKLIGTALLAWRLTGSVEKLFSKDGIMKLAGAFMTLDGGIGFVKNTFDAWINGLDWENFWGILGRMAELVGGLFLLFGKTGGAIGLIVTGLTLLATGFHDAEINGWNLQNMLSSVAGILATGIGITLLTNSFIPALIAAIAALLLAIVVTFGDGEKLIEDGKQMLQGFLDFFIGIFTGDIDRAMKGIGEIFDGLKGIAGNVLDSIKNMLISFLDWLDEKTGGRFHGIILLAKGYIEWFFMWAKDSFSVLAESLREIFGGIVTFISGVLSGDWDKAWEGVKDIFKGAWNGIVGLLGTAVNAIISGINWVIKKLNTIKVSIPEWVPGFGGKNFGFNFTPMQEWKIPYLAQGAVIPPNREFMAVLGDQRSGNNIEAPEGLIRKIVKEESGTASIIPELREILAAIREGKVMMMDHQVVARVMQETLTSATRAGRMSAIPVR